MSHSTIRETTTAGFTLIEVLVALSIVAIALSSIGALIASTVRGARSIDDRLTRLETARAVLTALPDRDQLVPGNFSGDIGGHSWRVDVLPFPTNNIGQNPSAPWVPQTVVVTVQSTTGAAMQISSVRLRRRDGG